MFRSRDEVQIQEIGRNVLVYCLVTYRRQW